MFEHDLNLKANELFLVGRHQSSTGIARAGLYLRDTRFLNSFDIAVNGIALETLSVRSGTGRQVQLMQANPISPSIPAPAQALALETRIELTDRVGCILVLQNFHTEALDLHLTIDCAADFADMFAVRGWPADRQGTLEPTWIDVNTAHLCYANLDGATVSTAITLTPDPTSIESSVPGRCRITFDVPLEAGASWESRVEIAPDPADGRAIAAVPETETDFAFWSSNDELQRLIDQSDADLSLLQTETKEGSIPAAGIPWYVAAFGRDSLIVGLQTMHVYPERIASTLRVLAANQGAIVNAFREEQPGKILHEIRSGELARSGQIPHTPYFGSIDSTPLFVMTFAQHYLWHRDESVWSDLVDAARHCIEWIEVFGDVDGDGLIEFSGTQTDPTHISQQGWKDSSDSLHHADGSDVEGPIALVEVQGYVHAAYAWLAEAAQLHGDKTWADELRRKAENIRLAVEERFWIEGEGFYAQALDGRKRRVESISSNPGHLLFCGLPSPERAARMSERLMRPDLYAGWGIRTLSSAMPDYNPMSYHNGSIWPHDTSLTMWGLREYGLDTAAIQLALGLVSLAYFSKQNRLAELYCGWPHEGHEYGPVDYPVSCSPQAWAAGSTHLVLRTLLGIQPDFGSRTVLIDPFLPEQFDAISVANLAAFGDVYDIAVHIHEGHYHVAPEGNVNIVVAGESQPAQ